MIEGMIKGINNIRRGYNFFYSHPHLHTRKNSLSLSLPFSHTHTRMHSHTLTHTDTHTQPLVQQMVPWQLCRESNALPFIKLRPLRVASISSPWCQPHVHKHYTRKHMRQIVSMHDLQQQQQQQQVSCSSSPAAAAQAAVAVAAA